MSSFNTAILHAYLIGVFSLAVIALVLTAIAIATEAAGHRRRLFEAGGPSAGSRPAPGPPAVRSERPSSLGDADEDGPRSRTSGRQGPPNQMLGHR